MCTTLMWCSGGAAGQQSDYMAGVDLPSSEDEDEYEHRHRDDDDEDNKKSLVVRVTHLTNLMLATKPRGNSPPRAVWKAVGDCRSRFFVK